MVMEQKFGNLRQFAVLGEILVCHKDLHRPLGTGTRLKERPQQMVCFTGWGIRKGVDEEEQRLPT